MNGVPGQRRIKHKTVFRLLLSLRFPVASFIAHHFIYCMYGEGFGNVGVCVCVSVSVCVCGCVDTFVEAGS